MEQKHHIRGVLGTRKAGLLLALLVLPMMLSGWLRADVGLMLNEALGDGASRWTGAGHASIYLSNICAATPVTVRPCEPGENGVVLTNYRDFGENRRYRWNAIPLNIYLYGVEDERERALYATPTVRWILEERYREKYMGTLCTGDCRTNPNFLWREGVAATFERDIYIFVAKTTAEQDQKLLAKLQGKPNVGHFNGATNNCADFVADILNTVFPRAARADHLNDLWMTSPKAIAKSFTHYAMRHRELELRVVRYTQVPGEFPASRDNRKGTEQLCRANKWRIPLAVIKPEILAVAGISYAASGRFNPEREMERRPVAEVAELEQQWESARARGDQESEERLHGQLKAARERALGTEEEWETYRERTAQYEDEYARIALGDMEGTHPLESAVHKRLAESWISLDERGGLWLRPRKSGKPGCGLSAATVQAAGSDAGQAYLLALARVESELRRKRKNRETIGYFRQDWALVERLRGELRPLLAGGADAGVTVAGGNLSGR